MKVYGQTKRKARIEMLPLIDIVFLLLVFFIYAMLSMAVHRGLPVFLPSSTSARVVKDSAVSVTVKSDGAVYVDKERVPLDSLTEALKEKARSGTRLGVLLFADRSLPYQDLFRILDRIRTAGLNHISLQAEVDRQR
jgi:biopolymer transport protein ExbD